MFIYLVLYCIREEAVQQILQFVHGVDAVGKTYENSLFFIPPPHIFDNFYVWNPAINLLLVTLQLLFNTELW
jgi:hypothetical protein